MCLGLPMKIVSIRGKTAVAEVDGVEREIGLHLVDDVAVDDYVVVHAGFAIEKIDKKAAEETIRLLQSYGISTQ